MVTAHSRLSFGRPYSKKQLAAIFGDKTLGLVREGRYNLKTFDSILLFVDLEKQGKDERFHFNDYFDQGFFHWDSQTTQHINTPTIQLMVQKRAEVNLFCRIAGKINNKTQPFYYCGRLEYVTHDPKTSKPVHMEFVSLDYDDKAANSNILALYAWKPQHLSNTTDLYNNTSSFNAKLKAKQKKPDRTEYQGLVTSRVGQGYYRQELRNKWNDQCALTGCDIVSILISSHIKRWSESEDEERLDVNNGILLSPNADALFDKYLITFSDKGDLLASRQLSEAHLKQLGVSSTNKLLVNKDMIPYLQHHRKRFLELEDGLSN